MKFIMLCGLPGTGKSTWVNQNFCEEHHNANVSGSLSFFVLSSNTYVISTDEAIEAIGRQYDLSYNEIFGDISYAFAERMIHKIAKILFDRKNIVIWDQTNLTVKSRKRKLDMVPEGYLKKAVIFNTPADHWERLNKRAEEQGKVIPASVIDQMQGKFRRPTLAEGFDVIEEVTME